MMKSIMMLVLCAMMGLAQADSLPSNTIQQESQQDAYHATMQQAGEYLNKGQAHLALAKILPFAQQGFAEAQFIVATLYEDGEGVAADANMARYWYTQAIRNDNPDVAELARLGLENLMQK